MQTKTQVLWLLVVVAVTALAPTRAAFCMPSLESNPPDNPVVQTTWYVSAAAISPFLGTVASPFLRIQDGIDAASNDDIVIVSPGVYHERINFLGKPILVKSTGGASITIIDGDWGDTVVRFSSGENASSILEGLTITHGGGSPPDRGSGILCAGTTPEIKRCIITANSGVHGYGGLTGHKGGGVTCYNAAPLITDCTISYNSGGWYAFIPTSSALGTIGGGGGIECVSSSPLVRNCLITGNNGSSRSAGGINGTGGWPVIVNCRLTGNHGGGVSPNYSGTPAPGAIFFSGDATITNCSITSNSSGPGIGSLATYVVPGGVKLAGSSGTPTITNSIVWMNSSLVGGPDEIIAPATSVTYCDVRGGFPGVGNIDIDPVWALPPTDLHLLPVSPCIDVGDNNALNLPATDFEGDPRVWVSVVDMGDDEWVNPQNPSGTVTMFGSGSGTGTMGIYGLPTIGGQFNINLSGAPLTSTSVHLVFGDSRTIWNGLPLPLNLGPLGAPGCNLLVAPQYLIPVSISGGTATLPVTLPNNPSLLGLSFFLQWAISDPPSNPAGLQVSQGAELQIG